MNAGIENTFVVVKNFLRTIAVVNVKIHDENTFMATGLRDFSGPVIRLPNLTPEELYVVLTRIRHIHAGGDTQAYALPDDALYAFMEHCFRRIGEAYFRTPRDTIRAFVQLLAILEQNPDVSWSDVLGSVRMELGSDPDLQGQDDPCMDEDADSGLTSFRL